MASKYHVLLCAGGRAGLSGLERVCLSDHIDLSEADENSHKVESSRMINIAKHDICSGLLDTRGRLECVPGCVPPWTQY